MKNGQNWTKIGQFWKTRIEFTKKNDKRQIEKRKAMQS